VGRQPPNVFHQFLLLQVRRPDAPELRRFEFIYDAPFPRFELVS